MPQYSEIKHKQMKKPVFLKRTLTNQYVLAKIIASIIFAEPSSRCGIFRCFSKCRPTDRLPPKPREQRSLSKHGLTLSFSRRGIQLRHANLRMNMFSKLGHSCTMTSSILAHDVTTSLHCWQNLSWARLRRWFHRSWHKLTLRENYQAQCEIKEVGLSPSASDACMTFLCKGDKTTSASCKKSSSIGRTPLMSWKGHEQLAFCCWRAWCDR